LGKSEEETFQGGVLKRRKRKKEERLGKKGQIKLDKGGMKPGCRLGGSWERETSDFYGERALAFWEEMTDRARRMSGRTVNLKNGGKVFCLI